MIIVIPLDATQRLINLARSRQLSLPIPLSSPCASYLSPAEMDTIVSTLTPIGPQDSLAANLLSELQDYREQRSPIIPCEGV